MQWLYFMKAYSLDLRDQSPHHFFTIIHSLKSSCYDKTHLLFSEFPHLPLKYDLKRSSGGSKRGNPAANQGVMPPPPR